MSSTDARTFAHQLAARDDASLAALLAARQVSPQVEWRDAFDAAEALLEGTSISRALTALSDVEAAALEAAVEGSDVPAGPVHDTLIARALLGDDGAPWAAVADAFAATTAASDSAEVDELRTASPDPMRSLLDPAGFVPASDEADVPAADDAAQAERAFTASASLADILQAALAAPLGRIGAGTLGAVDRKRLIDAGAAADAEAAEELVAIAARTGLLAAEDRAWLVTPAGAHWLHGSTLDRWTQVAGALIATLPPAVRRPGGGWIPVAAWAGAYPFDPAWPARAAAIGALLRRWAVLDPSGSAATWALPAATGGAIDRDALAGHLPPEVDRVYLQNDLTAIAPGTLAPQLDVRLRTMARRESRAQASSYRFTAETLTDALTAGETAESLRQFLQELSLTGLPQPLAYEIDRTASRHGALRVGPDGQGRARISSDDEALLRTVSVDQALRPLGLMPDGDALSTRSSPDTAFWMLADARYPVVAVDADGRRRTVERHRMASDPAPAPDAVEIYGDVIARLRAAQDGDADAAWLSRELDQAVRARATIVVTVRLPDGTDRDFTIEATGLGGGRLRGRDRLVDVERTLPVASIIRVAMPG